MNLNTIVGNVQALKALVVIFLSATGFQHANAVEVFKCVIDGKTTYQAMPCSSGGKTLTINAEIPSELTLEANRRASNEKQLVQRLESSRHDAVSRVQVEASREFGREDADNVRKQQERKLIADCEANHGVRCSDPKVIDENKRLNTPITHQEQQQAIAERRARKNAPF